MERLNTLQMTAHQQISKLLTDLSFDEFNIIFYFSNFRQGNRIQGWACFVGHAGLSLLE
jgi:hypothetical protein